MRLTKRTATIYQYIHFNRFFTLFFPLVAMVISGASLFYLYEIRTVERIISAKERVVLEKLQELIRNDFHMITSDLKYLAQHVSGYVSQTPDGFTPSPNLANEFKAFATFKKTYDQIRFLDKNGMEIVRVNYNRGQPAIVPKERLQNKGQRYYFKDTIQLNKNEVYISPFDLNVEKGKIEKPRKPMIRFGTPVFSPHHTRYGIVILNYLGEILLSKLKTMSNLSAGNIMLLNRNGYWLMSPNSVDEWGFMFPDSQNRSFAHRFPQLWERISAEGEGQIMTPAYLLSFTTIYPLDSDIYTSTGASEAYADSADSLPADQYGWKLVTRVPRNVFRAEIKRVSGRLLFSAVLLILVFAAAAASITRAKEKRDQVLREKEMVIAELQDALSEVKTLSGLIPICASCKKNPG